MRLVYISKSIIPSRTANSIHVMKMCQAFADNGHEVVLLAPDVKNHYENGEVLHNLLYNLHHMKLIKLSNYQFLNQLRGSPILPESCFASNQALN